MGREMKNCVLREVSLEQVIARSIKISGDHRLPFTGDVAEICELASRKEKRLNTRRFESISFESNVAHCLSPTTIVNGLERCNVNLATVSLHGIIRLKYRRAKCGEHSAVASLPSFFAKTGQNRSRWRIYYVVAFDQRLGIFRIRQNLKRNEIEISMRDYYKPPLVQFRRHWTKDRLGRLAYRGGSCFRCLILAWQRGEKCIETSGLLNNPGCGRKWVARQVISSDSPNVTLILTQTKFQHERVVVGYYPLLYLAQAQ